MSTVYREKLNSWKHGLFSNETHPDDAGMNIFMRNTQEKQSKTHEQRTRTSWMKHELGENNREINARKTLMVEEASLLASMFWTFSFKKKQVLFQLNYQIAPWIPVCSEGERARYKGRLGDCGVKSIWTLVTVTIETCEWNPPALKRERQQSWPEENEKIKNKKKPGDFMRGKSTTWVTRTWAGVRWGSPSCCFLPCLPQSWLMPDLTQHGQQQKHSQPASKMWLRKRKTIPNKKTNAWMISDAASSRRLAESSDEGAGVAGRLSQPFVLQQMRMAWERHWETVSMEVEWVCVYVCECVCVGGFLLWVGRGGGWRIIDRLPVLVKSRRGCTHSSWEISFN